MNPVKYKVFFAIPFDPAVFSMYQQIAKSLNLCLGDRFKFVTGDEEFKYEDFRNQGLSLSQRFTDLEAFKRQNIDLYGRFRSQITSSDIIVADLTNNNPNVHLELGIALSQSKNILRVSGKDLVYRASDIAGFHTARYQDVENLTRTVKEYLQMFLTIKTLPLSEKEAGPFYRRYDPLHLDSTQTAPYPRFKSVGSMRDGETKVRFMFKEADEHEAWFGIFFRYRFALWPWLGGCLVNVHKSGLLKIPELPSLDSLRQTPHDALKLNEAYTLHLMIDGSHLSAWLEDDFANPVEYNELKNQSYGGLAVACYACKVSVESTETVCRDTVESSDSGVASTAF